METECGVDVVAVAALQRSDSATQATVGVPGLGAEEPVVGQERWEEIHRLRAGGMTVSAIARSTGLDRKSVRRCVRQVRWILDARAVTARSFEILLERGRGVEPRHRRDSHHKLKVALTYLKLAAIAAYALRHIGPPPPYYRLGGGFRLAPEF